MLPVLPVLPVLVTRVTMLPGAARAGWYEGAGATGGWPFLRSDFGGTPPPIPSPPPRSLQYISSNSPIFIYYNYYHEIIA